MDNLYGLQTNPKSYPSYQLKEKFLEVLESGEISLDDLAGQLGLEVTSQLFETVHELVQNYEEKHGQLSLEKWKCIFEKSGYSGEFLWVVEHFNKQRHHPGLVSLKEGNDGVTAQLLAVSARFPNQVNELGDGIHDTAAAAIKVTGGSLSSPTPLVPSRRSWPLNSRSSITPEEKQPPDCSRNTANLSSTRVTRAGVTADSGFFSVNTNKDNNVLASASLSSSSLNSITKMEQFATSSIGQGMTNATDQSTGACSPAVSQISTPTLPHATLLSEANAPPALQTSAPPSITSSVSNQSGEVFDNQSLSSDCVSETDQQQLNESLENESSFTGSDTSMYGAEASSVSACTAQTTAVMRPLPAPPATDSQLPYSFPTVRRTRSGTENYDACENVGLTEELQKKNEELQSSVNFLMQKLQTKDLLYTNLQARNSQLNQELSECRSQYDELRVQNDEFAAQLNHSTDLEVENQRLIRMMEELVALKQENCDRLEEHIRQSDARYNSAMSSMEALRRDNQEVGESLAELRRQIEEHEASRLEESRRLRRESDKLMEDTLLAFNNAETDKVKMLKLKLSKEKARRRRAEERNKEICKDYDHLLQLRQREAEGGSTTPSVAACCADASGLSFELRNAEFCISTSEPSSGEGNDDPVESSSSSQHSGSDHEESSDDELYEDALEYINM